MKEILDNVDWREAVAIAIPVIAILGIVGYAPAKDFVKKHFDKSTKPTDQKKIK